MLGGGYGDGVGEGEAYLAKRAACTDRERADLEQPAMQSRSAHTCAWVSPL